jgi:hypothetical protein
MVDCNYWGQVGFLAGYVMFSLAIYPNFSKCEEQLGGWLVGLSLTALTIRFAIFSNRLQ